MLEIMKNAWKVKEIRNKIFFTIMIILIFRIGSVIPVPFIDYTKFTPARILVTMVVSGVTLTALGIYEPIIKFAGAGASVPLTGFGYSLAKGVEEAVKEYGAVFLMQIGGKLKSGQKHDGRAPDYDDWSLNGDILLYNKVIDSAFEISSMGIRVDRDALMKQLREENAVDRTEFEFHKMLLNGALPLTVGGGIGQSRLCMYLLQKAHIGEVQVSIWPEKEIAKCRQKGINLL